MSRKFETVMISRARTEKNSTLEQEFEAELKQLGKENAKCGKSLIQHISKAQGSTHRLVQDFVVSVPVVDFFLGFGPEWSSLDRPGFRPIHSPESGIPIGSGVFW